LGEAATGMGDRMGNFVDKHSQSSDVQESIGRPSYEPIGRPSYEPIGRPSYEPIGTPSYEPIGRPAAPPAPAPQAPAPVVMPIAPPRMTTNGHLCQKVWEMHGGCSNFCCNPDNDAGGEWCIVESSGGYGYCLPEGSPAPVVLRPLCTGEESWWGRVKSGCLSEPEFSAQEGASPAPLPAVPHEQLPPQVHLPTLPEAPPVEMVAESPSHWWDGLGEAATGMGDRMGNFVDKHSQSSDVQDLAAVAEPASNWWAEKRDNFANAKKIGFGSRR